MQIATDKAIIQRHNTNLESLISMLKIEREQWLDKLSICKDKRRAAMVHGFIDDIDESIAEYKEMMYK